MSWPIVGIVGIILLFILSYGVAPSPPSKPIQLSSFLDLNDTPNSYSGQAGKVPTVNGTENGLIFLDVNGGSGGLGDTNQVKVSANDTTPGYLENKLSEGLNVILSVLNEGGNESVEISVDLNGISGGGSGKTYTSGTPETIEVNNDNNTISQNFDGNFWALFALGEQYIDGNALAVINSLDLNNSLSYAKTDTNCSTSPDCNSNYIQKFPSGNQVIDNPNGFANLRIDGNFFPDVTRVSNIGGGSLVWKTIFGEKFDGRANNGGNNLEIGSNTCAFGVRGTEICLDFNNTSRAVGIREGIQNPVYYAKIGATSTTYGMQEILPRTDLPVTWGPVEPVDRNDLLLFDYTDYRFVQPLIYNPNWGTGANGWGHVDKIVYYGIGNDSNFITYSNIDQNQIGDLNLTGSIKLDANYFHITGIDGNSLKNSSVKLNLPSDVASGLGVDAYIGSEELFYPSSDARLKTNIRDLNIELDYNRIAQLQPKCWNSIKTGEFNCGLIAQDVNQLFPKAVYTNPDGYLGIHYEMLNIVLVDAIKKQIEINTTTKNKLAQAEAFITAYCTTGGHQNTPECQAV